MKSVEVIWITPNGIKTSFPPDYTDTLILRLTQVYQESTIRPRFPEDACFWTTLRLKNLGLKTSYGRFRLDKSMYQERGVYENHNWGLDHFARIIDLTLHQMNEGLDEKIPQGIVIIDKGSPFYQRFIPSNSKFNWE